MTTRDIAVVFLPLEGPALITSVQADESALLATVVSLVIAKLKSDFGVSTLKKQLAFQRISKDDARAIRRNRNHIPSGSGDFDDLDEVGSAFVAGNEWVLVTLAGE